MKTCSRCNGEGYETYEEDGRQVRDACYHCATTGKVDEETDFRDRLISAAEFLGRLDEQEYRHACNNDPNGDGYDLIAAEHGMMAGDYFRSRVWDRGYEIAAKVADLPIPDQEMLLAIYEGWKQDPWVEEPNCCDADGDTFVALIMTPDNPPDDAHNDRHLGQAEEWVPDEEIPF